MDGIIMSSVLDTFLNTLTPTSTLEVIPENIPAELKGHPTWVCWAAEPKNNGRINKPPYQPKSPNQKASKNNPDHWTDFATAYAAYRDNPNLAGVGYVVSRLHRTNGGTRPDYCFIDLDHCVEDGELSEEAQNAVNAFGSYAEFSPSGTGVRIVVRGRMPGPQFNNVKLGREMYDGDKSAYLTLTGHLVDPAFSSIEENYEALAFWYERWATPGVAQADPVEVGPLPDTVDLSKANASTLALINGSNWSAYPSRSEVVFGVCKDLFRSGFTEAQVLTVLSDPQYPISVVSLERRKTLLSAQEWLTRYTLPKARSEIAYEMEHQHLFAVEFDRETGEILSGIEPKPDEEKDALPEHLLDVGGLVGEIANWITEQSIRKQPVFSLAAALSVVSTATRNRYKIQPTGLGLNLYQVLVGDSTAGKDGPRKLGKRLLDAAGLSECCPEAISSGPAILAALSRNPTLLYLSDEMGKTLQAAGDNGNVHQQSIKTELMSLFSMANSQHNGKVYANGDNNIDPIPRPFVNVLGMTTPTELGKALSSDDATSGFLNRLIFVEAIDQPGLRFPYDTEPPEAVVRRLYAFSQHAGNLPVDHAPIIVIPMTQEAEAYIYETAERFDELARQTPLWARANENMIRVAGILAVSDATNIHQPMIDKRHLLWAEEYITWSMRRMVEHVELHVSDDRFDGLTKRALDIIRHPQRYAKENFIVSRGLDKYLRAGVMPKSILTRKMKLKSRELADVIDFLVGTGEIETGIDENVKSGPKMEIYRAI